MPDDFADVRRFGWEVVWSRPPDPAGCPGRGPGPGHGLGGPTRRSREGPVSQSQVPKRGWPRVVLGQVREALGDADEGAVWASRRWSGSSGEGPPSLVAASRLACAIPRRVLILGVSDVACGGCCLDACGCFPALDGAAGSRGLPRGVGYGRWSEGSGTRCLPRPGAGTGRAGSASTDVAPGPLGEWGDGRHDAV
jgi:hypothetical protein